MKWPRHGVAETRSIQFIGNENMLALEYDLLPNYDPEGRFLLSLISLRQIRIPEKASSPH